jgi:hypothetical protein
MGAKAPEDKPQKLAAATTELLRRYKAGGCPCAYPRFIALATFFHEDKRLPPVWSLDQELLVGQSIRGEAAWLEAADAENFAYRCRSCSSAWTFQWQEYNINFQFSYLRLVENRAKAVGADPESPGVLYAGFAGFSDKDIKAAMRLFRIEPLDRYLDYMKAARQGVPT